MKSLEKGTTKMITPPLQRIGKFSLQKFNQGKLLQVIPIRA